MGWGPRKGMTCRGWNTMDYSGWLRGLDTIQCHGEPPKDCRQRINNSFVLKTLIPYRSIKGGLNKTRMEADIPGSKQNYNDPRKR